MRSPKVPNHIQFPADTRYPSISLDEGLKASKLGTGRPLENREPTELWAFSNSASATGPRLSPSLTPVSTSLVPFQGRRCHCQASLKTGKLNLC